MLSPEEKKKFITYCKRKAKELTQIMNFIRLFRKIAKMKKSGLRLSTAGRQESEEEKEETKFCLILGRLIVSFLENDAYENFIFKKKLKNVKPEYYLRLIWKALKVVDDPENYNSLSF